MERHCQNTSLAKEYKALARLHEEEAKNAE
jgi:hypothetical protein